MAVIYLTKTIDNAHSYLKKLNESTIKRILDNKDYFKQKQMITGELLLIYAFKKRGFKQIPKIIYTPKPVVKEANIYISKTHSNNYVSCAISNQNIGHDIELIKDSKAAKKVLSNNEYQRYLTNKEKMFSLYWTIKEAYIKNIGFLIKPYSEIDTIQDFSLTKDNKGKVLDKYFYQTFYNNYSIALVSETPLNPQIKLVDNKKLIKGIK